MEKAFGKKIKIIEDQWQKQVEVLKDLEPKEKTKANEGKSNNQSRATIIFNDLIFNDHIWFMWFLWSHVFLFVWNYQGNQS